MIVWMNVYVVSNTWLYPSDLNTHSVSQAWLGAGSLAWWLATAALTWSIWSHPPPPPTRPELQHREAEAQHPE